MKKILLGLVAAFALTTIGAVAARAEEPTPAGEKPAAEGKTKKKGKKAKAAKEGEEAPAADKPAK
jgi:hypothetical protein